MTPFRLLGDGALASLRDRARAIMEDWRRDWFVEAGVRIELKVQAPAPGDLTALPAHSWWRAELQGRQLCIGLPMGGLTALAQGFMGGDAGDVDHPLLAAVAKDALANLAERLLRGPASAGTAVVLTEAEPPAPMAQRGSGCARMEAQLKGLGIEIWTDAAATAALAPRAAAAELPLVPLKSSLQDQRVTLRVELDLGAISAQRLGALQPGDVVTTNVPLHRDFTVLLPERGRIASGRLGRQGARHAVVLGN